MRTLLSFLFVVALLGGCSGQIAPGGASGDGGSSAAEPTPVPVDHGPPYSASEVAGAQAACGAPHGPVDQPATLGQLQAKLLGAWYLCSTSSTLDPIKSIEFDPDGNWYYLLDDGHGGLVRGQGIDSQGTYRPTDTREELDAGPDSPTNGFVDRNIGSGTIPDFTNFEIDPRRMQIVVGTAAFVEWFVYLGPSGP